MRWRWDDGDQGGDDDRDKDDKGRGRARALKGDDEDDDYRESKLAKVLGTRDRIIPENTDTLSSIRSNGPAGPRTRIARPGGTGGGRFLRHQTFWDLHGWHGESLSKILQDPIRSKMMKLQCAYSTPCFLKLCNCLYSQSVVDLVIWWHHDTLNSHECRWWTYPFTIVGVQNRRFTPFLKVCPKCGMSFPEPLYSGMDDYTPRSLMNGWCLMWMMWMILRVGHESHVIMGS